MQKLIAIKFVLFESKQYAPGEELPTHDGEIIGAWIDCGAAKWKDDADPVAQVVKARQVTAEPGRPGTAIPETGEDLTGRLPSVPNRKVKKK